MSDDLFRKYEAMTDDELADAYVKEMMKDPNSDECLMITSIKARRDTVADIRKSFENKDVKLNEEGNEIKQQLIVPQEGVSASTVAAQVGDFFNKKKLLFYNPIDRTVIKLALQTVSAKSDVQVIGFQQVRATEFITFLERFFVVGINKSSKNRFSRFVEKSLNPNSANILLNSEYQLQAKLPVLERIYNVPIPMVRTNSPPVLVFPTKGYDENLLSWLPPESPEVKTDMPLDKARSIIEQIYKEFCFKSEQDRINAIASLLTPFCRNLYKRDTCRTPVFFYKANRERAGKDYCAGIVGLVYEGAAIENPPICSGDGMRTESHDDEVKKMVVATFKSGRRRIHFSNNKGNLNSAVLEGLVTSELWEGRELGKNVNLMFPNTLEISLSANLGITYTPDLAARCVFINLAFLEEDTNSRKFENPNLHEWVLEHRGDILSALYAFVREWFNAGMPSGTGFFSSFPEWARVVGGIMENSGYGSPCKPNDDSDSVGGDRDTREMKRLWELCYETWPESWTTKKALIEKLMDPESPFYELFGWLDWGKDANRAKIKFAVLLSKFNGRVFSGIRMETQEQSHANRNLYLWTKGNQHQDNLRTKEFDGMDGRDGGVSPTATRSEKSNVINMEYIKPYQPPQPYQENVGDGRDGMVIPTPKQFATKMEHPYDPKTHDHPIIAFLKSQPRNRSTTTAISALLGKSVSDALTELQKLEKASDVYSPRPDEWALSDNDVIE